MIDHVSVNNPSRISSDTVLVNANGTIRFDHNSPIEKIFEMADRDAARNTEGTFPLEIIK